LEWHNIGECMFLFTLYSHPLSQMQQRVCVARIDELITLNTQRSCCIWSRGTLNMQSRSVREGSKIHFLKAANFGLAACLRKYPLGVSLSQITIIRSCFAFRVCWALAPEVLLFNCYERCSVLVIWRNGQNVCSPTAAICEDKKGHQVSAMYDLSNIYHPWDGIWEETVLKISELKQNFI
jgi:hypothetical protein